MAVTWKEAVLCAGFAVALPIGQTLFKWAALSNAKLSGSASALKTSYNAAQHALHVTIPDVAAAAELRVGD